MCKFVILGALFGEGGEKYYYYLFKFRKLK